MKTAVTVRLSTLERFSEQLAGIDAQNNTRLELTIKGDLTPEILRELTAFINNKALAKLSLIVNSTILDGPDFSTFIAILNSERVYSVVLNFSNLIASDLADPNHTIHNKLLEFAQSHVRLPLTIHNLQAYACAQAFQEIIIAKLHQVSSSNAPSQSLTPTPRIPAKFNAVPTIIDRIRQQQQPVAAQTSPANNPISGLAEQVQMVEVAQHVDNETAINQEAETYVQALVDFNEFNTAHYRDKVQALCGAQTTTQLYELLKQELFANLPHAIKYLTPQAAEIFALNLRALVSLNKDNLPAGFVLMKTPASEWVLHYNGIFDHAPKQAFAPPSAAAQVPLHDAYFASITLPEQLKTNKIFNHFFPNSAKDLPTPLINIYVRSGVTGVNNFLEKLNTCGPELLGFMMPHYLNYIPQWDAIDTVDFFMSMQTLQAFHPQKLAWAKKFLEHTGSSCHDLTHTLAQFAIFWDKLSARAKHEEVSLSEVVDLQWHTPTGGGLPGVYIQRMSFRLENARHLRDELDLLTGLCASNYGDYYAFRYEDFKSVGAVQQITYHADELNSRPFNPNCKYYHPGSLLELVNDAREQGEVARVRKEVKDNQSPDYRYYLLVKTEGNPQANLTIPEGEVIAVADTPESKQKLSKRVFFERNTEFLPNYSLYVKNRDDKRTYTLLCRQTPKDRRVLARLALRYIGCQTAGISLPQFLAAIQRIYRNGEHADYGRDFTYISSLFFICNKTFKPEDSIHELLSKIHGISATSNDKYASLQTLIRGLENGPLDIDVNLGIELFGIMRTMEEYYIKDYTEKLLTCVRKKPDETRRFFQLRNEMRTRYPRQSPVPFIDAFNITTAIEERILPEHQFEGVLLFAALIRIREVKIIDLQANISSLVAHNFQGLKSLMLAIASSKTYVLAKDFIQICASAMEQSSDSLAWVEPLLSHYSIQPSPASLPRILFEAKQLGGNSVALISELCTKGEGTSFDDLNRLWLWHGATFIATETERYQAILQECQASAINMAFCSNNLPDELAKAVVKFHDLQVITASATSDTISAQAAQLAAFARIDDITAKSTHLATLLRTILAGSAFSQNSKTQLTELLSNKDDCHYATLEPLLRLLPRLPAANHLALLQLYDSVKVTETTAWLQLISDLTRLNDKGFSSQYIAAFCAIYIKQLRSHAARTECEESPALAAAVEPKSLAEQVVIPFTGIEECLQNMLFWYEKDLLDPILCLIMTQHTSLDIEQIASIFDLSNQATQHRDILANFLYHLVSNPQLADVAQAIKDMQEIDNRNVIIGILSHDYAATKGRSEVNCYIDFINFLQYLMPDEFAALAQFCHNRPVRVACLYDAVSAHPLNADLPAFQALLATFEKNPFGPRDLDRQFDDAEVQRVINQAKDLLLANALPMAVREQIMAYFYYVNQLGSSITFYQGLAAKDLSDAAIQACFLHLKQAPACIDKSLVALALIREAMYRSTGEFPYSTQMIALIMGIVHGGKLVTNIETGQGKSLIDMAKAALLWLDHKRVDYVTSSYHDAQSNIADYGRFFAMLGIPYTKQALSNDPTEVARLFQENGVNLGATDALGFMRMKALTTNQNIAYDNEVALVVNESDTNLDNLTTFRLAVPHNKSISHQFEWVYEALNDWVDDANEVNLETPKTAWEYIQAMKAHLRAQASRLTLPDSIIDSLDLDVYAMLLNALFTVKFLLKPDVHYFIPEGNKVIQVIQADGKISPVLTLGNGVQQILAARYNRGKVDKPFVIKPLSTTIMSCTPKDFLSAYPGQVLGSSGTVGSHSELIEQHGKFGWQFWRLPPHQAKQVRFHVPTIAQDEMAQFAAIAAVLNTPNKLEVPKLVFFADIATANRFYTYIRGTYANAQVFYGEGDQEKNIIENAATPGMITISTSALGRNANIRVTDDFWVVKGSIGPVRADEQKDGRTGRQGKPGQVFCILNAANMPPTTARDALVRIQATRDAIEQAATDKRKGHEVQHDVLNYLLQQILALEPAQFAPYNRSTFFNSAAWSSFLALVAKNFQAYQDEPTDAQEEGFLAATFMNFTQLCAENLVDFAPTITVASYLNRPRTPAFMPAARAQDVKPSVVTKAQCTSSAVLAVNSCLHASNLVRMPENQHDKWTDIEYATLCKRLTGWFEEQYTDDALFTEINNYWERSASDKLAIAAVYKQFLEQLFTQGTRKSTLIERWLGYETMLHKIMHNKNYLTIYYVLTALSQHTQAQAQPLLALETVKNTLAHCLDEYLETSWWWISSERKTWISDLKGQINNQNSLDGIYACLAAYQVKAAEHDVEANKSRYLPMHWFGHSRFQTKLTEALNLVSHLRANTAASDNEIIEALTTPDSVVDGPQPDTGLTQVIANIRQQAQQRITFFGAPKQLVKPPVGQSIHADKPPLALDLECVASTASAAAVSGG